MAAPGGGGGDGGGAPVPLPPPLNDALNLLRSLADVAPAAAAALVAAAPAGMAGQLAALNGAVAALTATINAQGAAQTAALNALGAALTATINAQGAAQAAVLTLDNQNTIARTLNITHGSANDTLAPLRRLPPGAAPNAAPVFAPNFPATNADLTVLSAAGAGRTQRNATIHELLAFYDVPDPAAGGAPFALPVVPLPGQAAAANVELARKVERFRLFITVG